jgi:L-rhamnose mutarotase
MLNSYVESSSVAPPLRPGSASHNSAYAELKNLGAEYVRYVPVRKVPMQRVCFVLQVRPDKLTEYEERHRAVWPEMLQALKETRWTNYSLFLRPDGLLIGYLEAENFEQATQGMRAREVNARWQRDMAEFFVNPDILTSDPGPQILKEVFHLD